MKSKLFNIDFGYSNRKTAVGLLTLLLILFSHHSQAQQNNRTKFGELKAQRKAFVTEKLLLTSEEGQLFWPIYQKYTDELDELKIERIKSRKMLVKKLDNLSDKELDNLMTNDLTNDQKIVDLRKKYHQEFRKVLSAKKVINLYIAERQFKESLAKRWKDKGNKINEFGD